MNTLTFHITDIASNSVRAGATRILLEIAINEENTTIRIADNGCGMDAETIARVTDPFYPYDPKGRSGNPFPDTKCGTDWRFCQDTFPTGSGDGGYSLFYNR